MSITTVSIFSQYPHSLKGANPSIGNESQSLDFSQALIGASKNMDSIANSSLLNADSSKADKIEVKSISGSLESFVKDLQSLAQSLQIQAEKELSKKQSKAIEDQAILMQKILLSIGLRKYIEDHVETVKQEDRKAFV